MKNNSWIVWRKVFFIAFFIVPAVWLQTGQVRAQATSQPAVQQVKERLQQLEDSMQEVKAEINALETKRTLDSEVASLKAVAPPSTNVKVPTEIRPLITDPKPTAKQEPQEPQDAAKQTMEHENIPAPEGTLQMYGFTMLD